jgi:hypothetical protein
MDKQKQKEQGNQPQKDFGNQPNRGNEQSNQPGHHGQFPNKGDDKRPNQPQKEEEQQPAKR